MSRGSVGRIGFTTRASCLLAAGLTAVLCGILLGVTDLVRAGALGLAVPVVAAVVVRRSQLTVASRRDAESLRTEVGHPVQIQVTMTNRSVLPTGSLMLQDRLPDPLPGNARFVLDGLAPHETRVVAYRLPDLPRGRYRVGPLSVRLIDPFGMVDVTRSFASTTALTVTPLVERLTTNDAGGSWELGELRSSRSVGSGGAEDTSTREYRQGDDLRRIHWRSTARTGSLMVRQEERPSRSQSTVLLDARTGAHESVGSFEWLVSAAASIGTYLLQAGPEMHLVQAAPVPVVAGFTSAASLVDTLADARTARLRDLVRTVAVLPVNAMVTALLGRLDPESLAALTRVRGAGSGARLAILADVCSWEERPVSEPDALDAAATALRASGWRVAVARKGMSVADVWGELISTPVAVSGR